MTKEEITRVEQETIGQGENDIWIASRKFMLTASNFGMVINGNNNAKAIPESVFKSCLKHCLVNIDSMRSLLCD